MAADRVCAGEGVGPAGLGGIGDIELDGVYDGMDGAVRWPRRVAGQPSSQRQGDGEMATAQRASP